MANVHFVGSVALDTPEEVFATIEMGCLLFAPLANLRLDQGTELYLGLVHAQDGVEGTKNRIAAANKYVPLHGGRSQHVSRWTARTISPD